MKEKTLNQIISYLKDWDICGYNGNYENDKAAKKDISERIKNDTDFEKVLKDILPEELFSELLAS